MKRFIAAKHFLVTLLSISSCVLCISCEASALSPPLSEPYIKRISNAPIIHPKMDRSLGENIQGPSLIRVPNWIENRLGNYYLYFASHKGHFIRLAYADDLNGPWKIYTPGTLHLNQTSFAQAVLELSAKQIVRVTEKLENAGIDTSNLPHDLIKDLTTPHIASPDVHVDQANQRIVMYFHGLKASGNQVTRVATSHDGLVFYAQEEDLGKTYLRAFEHKGQTYALTMPGQFYRSVNGLNNFEKGPRLFNNNMRHAGLLKRDNTLFVFWTQVGDTPERILMSRIDVSKPWSQWRTTEPVEILRPFFDWEGANAPLTPSLRSVAYGHVNQLRDPYVFTDADKTYLLYALAGESGIGIVELCSGLFQ